MNTISCLQESSVESKWQPDLEQRSILSSGGRDQSGRYCLPSARAFNPQHTCKKGTYDDVMCDGMCDGMRL